MTELAAWQPTQAVAVPDYQSRAVQRLGEWAQSADAAFRVAERLVQSSFVPVAFRGKPIEAAAAILAGSEVGLSPMAALRSFDVIQGQAAPRAITLRAIVQSFGHEIVITESTAHRCIMRGRRKGATEWQTVTWTIDRAQALGLATKEQWKKQPQTMLIARATSELSRLIAADAILGIGYTAEEITDGAQGEPTGAPDLPPEPVEQQPTTRRMSRTMRQEPTVSPSTVREDDEPVDAEVEDEPAPKMTDRTRGALFALMGELGVTDDDEQRAFLTDTLNRHVESRASLTESEGVTAGKRLRRWQAGDMDAEWINTTADPADAEAQA